MEQVLGYRRQTSSNLSNTSQIGFRNSSGSIIQTANSLSIESAHNINIASPSSKSKSPKRLVQMKLDNVDKVLQCRDLYY